MLTYSDLKKFVEKKLSSHVYNQVLRFLQGKSPNLWGGQQKKDFLERNMVFVLYKYLKNVGFQNLLQEANFGSTFSDKSFRHNCHIILGLLEAWADTQLIFGQKRDWIAAARNVNRPAPFEKVVLWLDSFDVPKQNPSGWSKKDDDFSYKLNRYGSRYMCIRDGKGKVRKLWGGYTPKLYDSHFIKLKRKKFNKRMKGVHMIADQHFEYANESLTETKIWTNKKKEKSKKRKRDESEDEDQILTKADTTYNATHNRLRNRVENIFGFVSNLFQSLKEPWAESDAQLDRLVFFAMAVYNAKQD